MFGFASYAKSDTEDYLKGYPGQVDNPNLNENLRFYQGKISSKPQGDFIDVIHQQWRGEYDLLEVHHGYIQWLFPIREQGLNYEVHPLQKHEAAIIAADPLLQAKIMKSFDLMLDFYGMKLLNPSTGEVCRGDNYLKMYRNLVTHPHNFLRITRILKCLGEVGLEERKYGFLHQVILEQAGSKSYLDKCRDSLVRYWIPVVRDATVRKAMVDFLAFVDDKGRKAKTDVVEWIPSLGGAALPLYTRVWTSNPATRPSNNNNASTAGGKQTLPTSPANPPLDKETKFLRNSAPPTSAPPPGDNSDQCLKIKRSEGEPVLSSPDAATATDDLFPPGDPLRIAFHPQLASDVIRAASDVLTREMKAAGRSAPHIFSAFGDASQYIRSVSSNIFYPPVNASPTPIPQAGGGSKLPPDVTHTRAKHPAVTSSAYIRPEDPLVVVLVNCRLMEETRLTSFQVKNMLLGIDPNTPQEHVPINLRPTAQRISIVDITWLLRGKKGQETTTTTPQEQHQQRQNSNSVEGFTRQPSEGTPRSQGTLFPWTVFVIE